MYYSKVHVLSSKDNTTNKKCLLIFISIIKTCATVRLGFLSADGCQSRRNRVSDVLNMEYR